MTNKSQHVTIVIVVSLLISDTGITDVTKVSECIKNVYRIHTHNYLTTTPTYLAFYNSHSQSFIYSN
jgi:hypothetical protein